jgi:hypothetical protein
MDGCSWDMTVQYTVVTAARCWFDRNVVQRRGSLLCTAHQQSGLSRFLHVAPPV